MSNWNITIKDKETWDTFNSSISAPNRGEAESIAKEEYAYELDTTEENIEIMECKLITTT